MRTILDVASSLGVSPEHLAAAVAEALDRGLVRRERLREALQTLNDEERRSVGREGCNVGSGWQLNWVARRRLN